MDKWEYSYLIELKTLLEKEKLLVTSNFSFSHNVFKSCLLLMRQNGYLWSKGLKKKTNDLDTKERPYHKEYTCEIQRVYHLTFKVMANGNFF